MTRAALTLAVGLLAASAAAQPAPSAWEVAFELPRARFASIHGVGDHVFVGGAGVIARYDGRTWVVDRAGDAVVWSFHGDRPDDVVALGSRATILRFDGSRWTREHEDRTVGPRAGHDPELRRCEQSTFVVLRDFALRRTAGGWVRTALREVCAAPSDDRPGSCTAFVPPSHRWTDCSDGGVEVWSETERAWSRWPHRRRGRSPWRHWERGAHWYAATELDGVVFRHAGADWLRETLPVNETVWGMWGNGRYVYAIVSHAVLRRPL